MLREITVFFFFKEDCFNDSHLLGKDDLVYIQIKMHESSAIPSSPWKQIIVYACISI